MKIFSLPKYNMTGKQWLEVLTWTISIIIGLCVLRDCTVALKHDQEQVQQEYDTCRPVCYPHPVTGNRITKDGECICNSGVEYKKP
jgi:hypothetical protein